MALSAVRWREGTVYGGGVTVSVVFDPQQWGEALEAHFEAVYHDAMQGLPIVNSKMQVRLACLKAVRDGVYLGALVTPWYINLILKMVQQEAAGWTDRHLQLYPDVGVGKKVLMKFPSGQYEFVVNHQEALGFFYTCSLVTDMHSLENQAVAETIAEQSVHLVFDEAAKEPNLFRPTQVEKLNKIENEAADESATTQMAKKQEKSAKLPESPVLHAPKTASRRDFLRLKRRMEG